MFSLIANWRNQTKPSFSGVTHDILMERTLLAVTNRDWKPEHNDIKVHDVVMSEISWFVVVVDLGWWITSPEMN